MLRYTWALGDITVSRFVLACNYCYIAYLLCMSLFFHSVGLRVIRDRHPPSLQLAMAEVYSVLCINTPQSLDETPQDNMISVRCSIPPALFSQPFATVERRQPLCWTVYATETTVILAQRIRSSSKHQDLPNVQEMHICHLHTLSSRLLISIRIYSVRYGPIPYMPTYGKHMYATRLVYMHGIVVVT